MTQAVETKPQAILRLADYSQSGALAQVFMTDALPKQGVDLPGYQPGDTNTSVLARLLEGDAEGISEAIYRQAQKVADAGEAAVCKVFEGNQLFDGRAWFRVAVEIRDALDGAISQTDAIASLNDLARTEPAKANAMIVLTPGVKALIDREKGRSAELTAKLAAFSDFDPGNNPYGERDMGRFDLWGARVMWKIDYYDLKLAYHSEAAWCSKATRRVLTIMLTSEY